MQISDIPYTHRSGAADLLIAKANRLADHTSLKSSASTSKERKAIRKGIYLYEIALNLLKPYDVNYCTVLNWKCNALVKLGRFSEAIKGYEAILQISTQTTGQGPRNTYARYAEDAIKTYGGKDDRPQDDDADHDTTIFDEPWYCTFSEDFCDLLAAGKFKQAHSRLSEALQTALPISTLRSEWERLVQSADSVNIALLDNRTDRSDRSENEIGWCYFSLTTDSLNEGIAIVTSLTEHNTHEITDLEFGRP